MIKEILNKHLKAVQFGWPFVLILVIIFHSCGITNESAKPKGIIAAEVGDYYLTVDELVKVFGKDWQSKTNKVDDFIRIWAKGKVVGIEAENTLTEKDKDFSKEIDSYKTSLLKYTYEAKLLDSALNLEVSQREIQAYFELNQKNFELKENIIRVRYVKVPKKHKRFNQIKYLLQYKDTVRKEKFFSLVQSENFFCEANDSLWLKLDKLKNLIPFKLYNDEHFLRNYKYTEAPDGDDVWMIYFSENRLKKGVAPIEMVEDKIKAIIINQRKQELIQKKEMELYNRALKNKEIKVYVENK
jgi:hypothetical protein